MHFGKFIGGYISGHYFFDIHPPFGKLLIALVAYLGGYRTTQVATATVGLAAARVSYGYGSYGYGSYGYRGVSYGEG